MQVGTCCPLLNNMIASHRCKEPAVPQPGMWGTALLTLLFRLLPWLIFFFCCSYSHRRRLRPPACFGDFFAISWRNPHSVCRHAKSPTRATVKIRRTRQRGTCPSKYAATLRICLLSTFNDQLEFHCLSYGPCPIGRCIPGSATPIARSVMSRDTADQATAPCAPKRSAGENRLPPRRKRATHSRATRKVELRPPRCPIPTPS